MRRRLIASILFWSGLMVSTAGFLIGQANRIPFILQTIAPTYSDAMSGYRHLMSSGSLADGDPGFKALHDVDMEILRRLNPPEALVNADILKFTSNPGAVSPLKDDKTGEAFMASVILVHLSNGQKPMWNDKHLKDALAELRENSILRFAVPIFAIGVFIQVLSRFVKPAHVQINKPKDKTEDGSCKPGNQKNTDCQV